MPTKNELIMLYAGLNMQALMDRSMTSGAAFTDAAGRAHRSAVTLVEYLAANVPGLVRDDAKDDDRDDLREELYKARDELHKLRAEIAPFVAAETLPSAAGLDAAKHGKKAGV